MLGFASALSPFGMVVVVPTLNALAQRYGTDFGEVQYIVSAYLFGLGIAQPFSGLLCDRFGRRPVVLAGFALFVLASIGCAEVDTLDWLIGLRFLQAIGVSVGTVASRAIIRDTHDEAGTASAMSLMAVAMGVSPVLGPVIGGLLGNAFGPQSVFWASAILGAIAWLQIRFRLTETLSADAVITITARHLLSEYRDLLKSRVFMGYTLMYGLVQGAYFAFLAVGAAVFEHDLQLGQRGFGLVWGLMAIAYVSAAFLAGRLNRVLGLSGTLRLGMAATLLTGWAIFALATGPGLSRLPFITLLALLTAASGLVVPGSMAGAVNYRPEIAGTSTGLSSALGLLIGGGFSIVSGVLYKGSFPPVATLMAAGATLTLITGWMVSASGAPSGLSSPESETQQRSDR